MIAEIAVAAAAATLAVGCSICSFLLQLRLNRVGGEFVSVIVKICPIVLRFVVGFSGLLGCLGFRLAGCQAPSQAQAQALMRRRRKTRKTLLLTYGYGSTQLTHLNPNLASSTSSSVSLCLHSSVHTNTTIFRQSSYTLFLPPSYSLPVCTKHDPGPAPLGGTA